MISHKHQIQKSEGCALGFRARKNIPARDTKPCFGVFIVGKIVSKSFNAIAPKCLCQDILHQQPLGPLVQDHSLFEDLLSKICLSGCLHEDPVEPHVQVLRMRTSRAGCLCQDSCISLCQDLCIKTLYDHLSACGPLVQDLFVRMSAS